MDRRQRADFAGLPDEAEQGVQAVDCGGDVAVQSRPPDGLSRVDASCDTRLDDELVRGQQECHGEP